MTTPGSSAPARGSVLSRFERWITGDGELTEPEAGARLVARVLVVLLPVFVAMATVAALTRTQTMSNVDVGVGMGIATAATTALMLARRGKGRSAAIVMVWTGILGSLPAALREFDPASAIASVLFSLTGVLYASYLLPLGATLLASLTAVAVALLLPVLHPTVTWPNIVIPTFFICVMSILAAVGARIRAHQFATILRQSADLRERESRLRVLMDASPDAVVGVTRAGRIVEWSRPAEQTFGWTRAEALGRLFGEFVFVPEAQPILEEVLATAEAGGPARGEGKAKCRDGRIIPVELSAAQLTLAKGEGFAVFARDITERRKLQAEILLTDRMVTAGRLAAGVAHEINNPMTYVISNLEYLRLQVEQLRSAPALIQVVDESLEGARRVQSIVKDMRTFSRIEDDDAAPIDMRRVLDSAVQLAWNEIRHRARLVKRYEPVSFARGSEGRLGQVFLNLVVNAAQAFTDNDLQRNEIEVSLAMDAQGRVVGKVRDTGPGIPEDIRARIFSPFFTTKPVGEGTGLGLWVARSIIVALGGEITVESEPGKGTTFTVALPTAESVAPRERRPAVHATGGRPLSILIVDDDLSVGRALRRLLEGHDVTVASSGLEALRLCRDRRFDLVLCDVMMPGLPGTAVAERLTREQQVPADRIVLMTGSLMAVRAKHLVNEDDRLLEKPIDRNQLDGVLRAVAGMDPFSTQTH